MCTSLVSILLLCSSSCPAQAGSSKHKTFGSDDDDNVEDMPDELVQPVTSTPTALATKAASSSSSSSSLSSSSSSSSASSSSSSGSSESDQDCQGGNTTEESDTEWFKNVKRKKVSNIVVHVAEY